MWLRGGFVRSRVALLPRSAENHPLSLCLSFPCVDLLWGAVWYFAVFRAGWALGVGPCAVRAGGRGASLGVILRVALGVALGVTRGVPVGVSGGVWLGRGLAF